MKIFIISLLFGVGEMLLLSLLMKFSAEGNKGRAVLVFFSKVVTYTAVIGLFVFKYLAKYMYCISGFAMGVAVSAILLFLYNGFIKNTEEE